MPRRACCWTRKMEIDLVDFVRQKECIWKPLGNTNYHIQQKYQAYAEFAERLGRGFTARSVRDRWVNIRSTFNHNVRRVERSKEEAASMADIFTPCWPLWKPLQFLRNNSKKDVEKCEGMIIEQPFFGLQNQPDRTEGRPSNEVSYEIKQKPKEMKDHIKNINLSNSKKCVQVIDNLISAIQPIINNNESNIDCKSYWYFGRYVTERLNNISQMDAVCASQRIVELINKWPLFSEYSGQFVF